MKYCIECGKEKTDSRALRCLSCSQKERQRIKGHRANYRGIGICIECGKKIDFRSKRCSRCAAKNTWKNPTEKMCNHLDKISHLSRSKNQIEVFRKIHKMHISIFEKSFKKALEDANISFEWQAIINFPNGSFLKFAVADFLVDSNIIVEIDGWSHQIDSSYDIQRDEICMELGYVIFRFSHEDIKNHLNFCILKILDILAIC